MIQSSFTLYQKANVELRDTTDAKGHPSMSIYTIREIKRSDEILLRCWIFLHVIEGYMSYQQHY